MGNNRGEEVSKEFFLENLINRIISVKKRLDYLIFILLVLTSFAMYYLTDVPKKFIFFQLDGLDASVYHGIIAISSLVLFGIIGSHFIEYIIKRNMIDKELKVDPFFKGKRWREEKEKMEVEEGNEKLLIISSMMAPSSFYEFFYTLSLTARNLRGTAAVVLLLLFLLSHAVAYFHIIQLEIKYFIPEVLGVLWYVIYFFLYREFVKSIYRRKEKLYEMIIKPLIYIFITHCILIIAIRVYMRFFS
jgi:hypothetical protein